MYRVGRRDRPQSDPVRRNPRMALSISRITVGGSLIWNLSRRTDGVSGRHSDARLRLAPIPLLLRPQRGLPLLAYLRPQPPASLPSRPVLGQ